MIGAYEPHMYVPVPDQQGKKPQQKPGQTLPLGKGKGKRICIIAPLMKLHLNALRYGSHRVATANYTIPAYTLRTFARWRHLNGRHLIPARYSLPW